MPEVTSERTHLGFVTFFAVAVALSGSLYTSVERNATSSNDAVRAVVTLGLLSVLALRVITIRVALPRGTGWLFVGVAYMASVGLLRAHGVESLGAVARWALYFGVFAYFASIRSLDMFRRFVTVSAICHLGVILVAVYSGQVLQINGAQRLVGNLGSAVGLAALLLTLAVGLLYLHLVYQQSRYLFLALLMVLLIFTTGTRALAVGGVVACLIYGLFLLRSRVTRTAIGALSIVSAIPAARWVSQETELGGRLKLLSDGGGADSSLQFRLYIVAVVKERFGGIYQWTGLGMGRFPEWFEAQTGLPDIAPHMEAVWLWSEGGVIGGGLVVVSLLVLTQRLWRDSRKNPRSQTAALFFIVCMWLQQTVFQFANPGFFFQVMCLVYAYLGYFLSATEDEIALAKNLVAGEGGIVRG